MTMKSILMEPILVDIDQVKPYRTNAKLHPPEQIDLIIRSINLTGFDQPIVCDTSYVIIKGHGRLLAAQQLAMKQVPVIVLDIPKDIADKARLIDNKSSESGYDLEILLAELSRFQDDNIQDTGYDEEEFKDLMNTLEQDSAIANYDWNSLEGAEKSDDSEEKEGEIVLKFAIPSSMKETVLEFLNIESDKPAVLGEALIKLCCEN